MPFLSKDWRSPGEEWVRFEGGWERKKIVWPTSHYCYCVCSLSRSTNSSSKRENRRSVAGIDSVNIKCVCEYQLESGNGRIRRPSTNSVQTDTEDESSTTKEPFSSNPKSQPISIVSRIKRFDSIYENNNYGGSAESMNVSPSPSLKSQESGYNQQTKYSSNAEWPSPLIRDKNIQPYCPITLKNTKEIAGFNGLADALLRLDFINAVRDIRRFNYVAKIMDILFSHDKLSQLPGAAQKILFRMLEEMTEAVYENNVNQHVLRRLLDDLHATLSIYKVWGSHHGSSALFQRHLEARRKIVEIIENSQGVYKQDLADSSFYNKNSKLNSSRQRQPSLTADLPEECVREIILRLSDPSDIKRTADVCVVMNSLAKEKRVWRELAQTHFTRQQIEFLLNKNETIQDGGGIDWKDLYGKLKRKFGTKEEFTETLMLCRRCRVLFWQSIGHPCLLLQDENDSEEGNSSDVNMGSATTNNSVRGKFVKQQSNKFCDPVSPTGFLSYFSV